MHLQFRAVIGTHLLKASLLTTHPEAELLLFGTDNGGLGGDQCTIGIVQQHGEAILKAGGVDRTARTNETGHALRQAEEVHCLVQKVGAEVIDGRTTGNDLVLPLRGIGGGLLGTVAVKVGFEFRDAAKRAVLNQLGERDEVGVPAAV